MLRSSLGEREILEFLLHRYAPTPVVAPWNGGSGFHPGDNRAGIVAIEGTEDPRFGAYRRAIAVSRRVLADLGLTGKPPKEEKLPLLAALRSDLGDDALAWFDAALVLTADGPKFPPLLGTGGNDGRLDFTNNQMQRLSELLLAATTDEAAGWLRSCLFGDPAPRLQKGSAIGQFNPAAAGGANAGPGFDRAALVNPWQYVLMIEGSLLFAAAASRRLESTEQGTLTFPFCVRTSGSGYASAARSDEENTRNEIWVPLWRAPARIREISALLTEGRAKVGGRSAATGVDFARALATFGTDRGIDEFARYGFYIRNGLGHMATPLGRWRPRRNESVDLISQLDVWRDQFRRSARDGAPASVVRAHGALEDAILGMCRDVTPRAVAEVLAALGGAEATLTRSMQHTATTSVHPVPPLTSVWLAAADEGTPEYRLAASLASIGIREHLVPVRWARPFAWQTDDDGRTVWSDCDLVRNLVATLRRRELELARGGSAPTWATRNAALGDVAAFIEGSIDEGRLERLLRGLSLVDPRHGGFAAPLEPRAPHRPPALFAALAIVISRRPVSGVELPSTPGLVARAAAGDAAGAVALAVRRLRGAGLVTIFDNLHDPAERTRRAAAALLFPLAARDIASLAETVLRPVSTPNEE